MNCYPRLKLLDDILEVMYNSPDRNIDYLSIKKLVIKSFSPKEGEEAISLNVAMYIDEFHSAMVYLRDKAYIRVYDNETVYILYKGVVKVDMGGFVEEAKQLRRVRSLNIWYIYVAIFLSILSCFLTYYFRK